MYFNEETTMQLRSMAMGCALLLVAGVLALAASVWAQSTGGWPTTDWVVMDGQEDNFLNQARGMVGIEAPFSTPKGERRVFAEKHKKMLEAASIWYESQGFPPPVQWTEDWDLDVGPGESYLALLKADTEDTGSSHSVEGLMKLTTSQGFLAAETPGWKLMEASAVHELYHGIQKRMSPALRASNGSEPAGIPECRDDIDTDWIVEGTAAMIQVRWLEGQKGVSWGHPFAGSNRAAWVRHFDQPLHRGALPPEHRGPPESRQTSMETKSWACDYGAWYFWYAIGDMIGRNERERVAYTRWLFEDTTSWRDSGIAKVDAGLKAAAAAYDAIRPYRGGLYDLYPRFVAQYLVEDRFYGELEELVLGAPDLYQTTSSLSGGPLGPLATRAWRVRVRLPANASPIPYNVRFTLDAPDGTDRDQLHLIVDERVVARPVDPTAPYADVQRTHLATPAADGTVDYLVRVANVAEAAADTTDAEFSLRVEVDGFYGSDVSGGLEEGDIGRIAGDLPPGFDVRGPKPWSCSSNGVSRAIYEVITPDEAVRDLERAMPQAERNTETWLDELEIRAQQAERQGQMTESSREELAAFRQQMEQMVAAGRAALEPDINAAAGRARTRNTTRLAATFVGRSGDGECQMTLGATLEGREGGAQVVRGAVNESRYPPDEAPEFAVRVHPDSMLRAMRAGIPTVHPLDPRRGDWEVCMMNEAEQQRARGLGSQGSCPPVVCSAGRLTLESAQQGRIAGTFEFDVVRWPKDRYASGCEAPLAREQVVGHFNVSSTDDGYGDAGQGDIMTSSVPGAPIVKVLP